MKPSVNATHSRNLLSVQPSHKDIQVKIPQTEFCLEASAGASWGECTVTSIFRLPQSREDFPEKISMSAADLWKIWSSVSPWDMLLIKRKQKLNFFKLCEPQMDTESLEMWPWTVLNASFQMPVKIFFFWPEPSQEQKIFPQIFVWL